MYFRDPNRYVTNAGFVAKLGEPLLELLAPEPGLRVLDLGCGEGALTSELLTLGCEVVGVDSSAEQVEAARARGLEAQVVDGQKLEFEDEFDAVFSNAALHWMPEADAVVAGVWRALRPGGRFVAEKGGHGNVATIGAALVAGLERRGIDTEGANPWYFGHPDEYRRRLENQGFDVPFMAHFSRPTPLPGEMKAWLLTFAESYLSCLPASQREAYLDEVQGELGPQLQASDGTWIADYVRLRFLAHKR